MDERSLNGGQRLSEVLKEGLEEGTKVFTALWHRMWECKDWHTGWMQSLEVPAKGRKHSPEAWGESSSPCWVSEQKLTANRSSPVQIQEHLRHQWHLFHNFINFEKRHSTELKVMSLRSIDKRRVAVRISLDVNVFSELIFIWSPWFDPLWLCWTVFSWASYFTCSSNSFLSDSAILVSVKFLVSCRRHTRWHYKLSVLVCINLALCKGS